MAAARDRADLLGGGSDGGDGGGLGSQSSMGLLLRERGMVSSSAAAANDVIGQAQAVAASLAAQRAVFDGIGGRVRELGARFPVVNSLLNAVRRKKSRDSVVLAAVVALCTLGILAYWWSK